MGSLVLGVFLTALAQVAPLNLGNLRRYIGDSQTAGRASGVTESHVLAVEAILDTLGVGGGSFVQNGISGRDLPNTIAEGWDDEATKANTTLLWTQESGNQDFTGQNTAAAFKATVLAFYRAAVLVAPNCIFVYETAFSFGRTGFPRDWDAWNEALREAVAELALEGITVIIVETDAAIKALQASLVGGEIDADEAKAIVWYPSTHPTDAYHYTEVGNLMVAIIGLYALGYRLTLDDLVAIDNVSTEHKAACLAVAESLY